MRGRGSSRGRSGCGRRPVEPRARLERDETARETAKQVVARKSLPLLVRLEQRRSLLDVDPPAVDRLAELQQTEVADEAEPVAAESLESDHANRPRAEPSL